MWDDVASLWLFYTFYRTVLSLSELALAQRKQEGNGPIEPACKKGKFIKSKYAIAWPQRLNNQLGREEEDEEDPFGMSDDDEEEEEAAKKEEETTDKSEADLEAELEAEMVGNEDKPEPTAGQIANWSNIDDE